MTSMWGRTLVAAIGNRDRGDDGFGPAVADRLQGQVPAGVRILECGGDVLALIEEWTGVSAAILVDASAADSRPGRVHRLDFAKHRPFSRVPHSSTHAFGIAETIELARSLDRLPRHLVAYLVEGKCFDIGAPLSPAVAAAVEPVAIRILSELSLGGSVQLAEGAAKHA